MKCYDNVMASDGVNSGWYCGS